MLVVYCIWRTGNLQYRFYETVYKIHLYTQKQQSKDDIFQQNCWFKKIKEYEIKFLLFEGCMWNLTPSSNKRIMSYHLKLVAIQIVNIFYRKNLDKVEHQHHPIFLDVGLMFCCS